MMARRENQQASAANHKSADPLLKPILPINMQSDRMMFLDLHPLEVARQMTLVEFNVRPCHLPRHWRARAHTHQRHDARLLREIIIRIRITLPVVSPPQLYKKIQACELHHSAWTKGRAPNVQAITERFNKVPPHYLQNHNHNHHQHFFILATFSLSLFRGGGGGGGLRPQVCFWVATEIITTEDHATRIEVLSRFIQVALVQPPPADCFSSHHRPCFEPQRLPLFFVCRLYRLCVRACVCDGSTCDP